MAAYAPRHARSGKPSRPQGRWRTPLLAEPGEEQPASGEAALDEEFLAVLRDIRAGQLREAMTAAPITRA